MLNFILSRMVKENKKPNMTRMYIHKKLEFIEVENVI